MKPRLELKETPFASRFLEYRPILSYNTSFLDWRVKEKIYNMRSIYETEES